MVSKETQPPLNPRSVGVLRKEDSAADVTQFVPVDVDCMSYLSLYKQDELQRIEKDENVKISERVNGYDVKGETVDVTWAASTLGDLVNGVKCSRFSFVTGVDVRKFAETAVTTGKMYRCLIGYKSNVNPVSRQRAQSAVPFAHGNQGVKVTVVFNKIEKQKADVIVNTTNNQLNLSSGSGVSYSLLQVVGTDIQKVLYRIYPDGIEYGHLAVTSSGKLDTCKRIYHGCLPYYKGFMETFSLSTCYECLVSLVLRCLVQASKDGFQTIAMPAFGTGALQYPIKNFIQLMYHAIDRFTKNNSETSLKEIFIVTSLETRLQVKQLLLAHGITHKLKTRWLEPPRHDVRRFFRRLFAPRTDRTGILPEFLEREVRRPGQTNCEFRVMIEHTLVQIINGSINEVRNATQNVLLMWKAKNRGISDPSPARSMTTRLVTDSTTTTHKRRVSVTYSDHSLAAMVSTLSSGLRLAAEKEFYHVTVPLESKDIVSPDLTSKAIVSALQSVSDVYVMTIAVPNTNCYIDLVTRIAQHGIVQKPPDVANSLVGSQTKFSRRRSGSIEEMHTTAGDAVMVVTSDSEETNRNVARDVERELHVQLQGPVTDEEVVSAAREEEASAVTNFTSGAHFFEQVEDAKDSVWLIQVYNVQRTPVLLGDSRWKSIRKKVSRFGVRAGILDCSLDMRYCLNKGWHTSRLLLALPGEFEPNPMSTFTLTPDPQRQTCCITGNGKVDKIAHTKQFVAEWYQFKDPFLNPEIRTVYFTNQKKHTNVLFST